MGKKRLLETVLVRLQAGQGGGAGHDSDQEGGAQLAQVRDAGAQGGLKRGLPRRDGRGDAPQEAEARLAELQAAGAQVDERGLGRLPNRRQPQQEHDVPVPRGG